MIVVDKLLTGFDAPPASYMYIDKSMRDHGLFQAICRINRLDGEDKEYGLIIDYKDLFKNLETAVTDYTSDVLDGYDPADVIGLLNDRLEQEKKQLESSLETIRLVCEPVKPTKEPEDYSEYFCGNPENADDLQETAQKRNALYKSTSSLFRAFSAISCDMTEAGYSSEEISKECVKMVREKVGPVAAFKTAIVIKRLPKTRSGKILRGTVRKIADNEPYKMPATIDDPAILSEIKEDLKKHQILK